MFFLRQQIKCQRPHTVETVYTCQFKKHDLLIVSLFDLEAMPGGLPLLAF